MKKKFVTTSIKVVLLIVATIATFGTPARGQSLDHKMKANIPFDFEVAGQKFSAGQYSVGRAFRESGDLVLRIDSSDGHSRAIPLTIPVNRLDSQDKGSLVFHRYGDDYFLSQVWPAAANWGREFTKSRAERQAEKRVRESVGAARKTDSVETVIVMAYLP
jgi:hypothetical protein